MTELGIIYVTAANSQEAKTIAKNLVESRLAACVNIIPAITSIYRWDNKINEESELLLIIKAPANNYPAIESKVKSLHSYQTPEIIFTPITKGSKQYLDWISSEAPEIT